MNDNDYEARKRRTEDASDLQILYAFQEWVRNLKQVPGESSAPDAFGRSDLGEVSRLPIIDGLLASPEVLLERLSGSEEIMPEEYCRLLGLRAGATYADGVREVHWFYKAQS